MIAFLLDAIGSFLLSRLSSNRLGLIVAAIVLGLANGFIASALTGLILGEFAAANVMASVMTAAAVIHPVVCVVLALWFRVRLERRTGA